MAALKHANNGTARAHASADVRGGRADGASSSGGKREGNGEEDYDGLRSAVRGATKASVRALRRNAMGRRGGSKWEWQHMRAVALWAYAARQRADYKPVACTTPS